MELTRRLGFYLFVLISLVAGTWAYFHLKYNKRPRVDAASVMQEGCLLYAQVTDLSELNRKMNDRSILVEKLKAFSAVESFCRHVRIFDSLLAGDELLIDQLKGNPVHLALYGGKPVEWLASCNISEFGRQEEVRARLASNLKARNFSGNIYEFSLPALGSACYYRLTEGVLAVSDSRELLESSQPGGEGFMASSSFGQYQSVFTDGNLLSVYLDHAFYGPMKAASHLRLHDISAKATSAGAISIEPSELRVNGYIQTDSVALVSSLQNQDPAESAGLFESLPAAAVSFTAYAAGSFTAFVSRLGDGAGQFWRKAEEKAMFNVRGDFFGNAGGSLFAFSTGQSDMVSVDVADSAKAREHLRLMSDTVLGFNGASVYRLAIGNAPVLFSPFVTHECSYAAVAGMNLYFGSDSLALAAAAAQLASGRDLSGEASFTNYARQHIPDRYNYLVYEATSLLPAGKRRLLAAGKDDQADPLSALGHLSYSLLNDAEGFRYRMHLQYVSGNGSREQNSLWSTSLDTISESSPSLFVNHNSGEHELVITDAAGNLYLLDAKGNVLWKKRLNEASAGEVHRIDAFRNGKFQMLFASRNYLHLIDRKGNYVSGFPVKLPAEATSPLSILDYDDTREYRLLIACADRKIYNFTAAGAKVEGFEPVSLQNPVKLPVRHLRVAGNDFLMALDDEGKLYAFNRKGATRISLKNRAIAHCVAFLPDAGNSLNNSYVYYLDDRNFLLNKISLTDRKEIVKLSGDGGAAYVHFELVDDNRHRDVVVTLEDKISAFDLNGNLLYEKNSPDVLVSSGFYGDATHSVLYAFSRASQTVRLFFIRGQKERKLQAGAPPLICDLFRDKKVCVVAVHGSKVSCTLLD